MRTNAVIDIDQIEKILPQSTPFLFIDKVLTFTEHKDLLAIKNITANEWFCEGGNKIKTEFPGTLLIEAASQAALILYYKSMIKNGDEKPKLFLGKVKAVFHKSVRFGDQLRINVKAAKMLKELGIMNIKIDVEKDEIAEIDIMYSKHDGHDKRLWSNHEK